jgi:hypothetical protein
MNVRGGVAASIAFTKTEGFNLDGARQNRPPALQKKD